MKLLDMRDRDFDARFAVVLSRYEEINHTVEREVADIVAAVRVRGDQALLEMTGRFDHVEAHDLLHD